MAQDLSARLTAAEGRRFGYTVGAALLVLAAAAWWRDHPGPAAVFSLLGAALLLGGMTAPRMMLPVRDRWMWLAERISRITTPIVMGILYFLVITPVGLLMRLTRRAPLTAPKPGDTVWATRASNARRSDLRRQF